MITRALCTLVGLLVAAATDYQGFAGRNTPDPVAATADDIARATGKTLAQLRSAHVADHRGYFDRVGIRLDDVLGVVRPQRIDYLQLVPALVERLGIPRPDVEGALAALPGMRVVFTQPIEMRFNEMIAGVRGDEHNVFYERVDNRAEPGRGQLRRTHDRVVRKGSAVALLPDDFHDRKVAECEAAQ